MEHTLALIEKAHGGDKEARETLVEENMGLVYTIVRRFAGRGHEMEDLIQIGSIGLIKAIDKFNSAFDVKFSTYAVPMIAGEIKRFLRDDGMIKVSRSLKETAGKAYMAKEALEKKYGREPTLEEISEEIGAAREDIVLAMESAAEVESLHKTIYQGDGNAISLMDKLEEQGNPNEELLNHMVLNDVIQTLHEEERILIRLRYFEDKTQMEVARALGMSQVQVSRYEKKILKKMRGRIS
ncbi:MAG: RNA polymerase sporulation sigma factor SigF [Lachnospiraceae bacterium]|nr:RNA polymerase sporulation sigma factor SigF [Lachnospiraceae bacterium]